jgi:hypothetical protein
VQQATSARVTLRNGRWHVSLTTPPPSKIVAATGAGVGVDRGVANSVATSEGQLLRAPGLTVGERHRFLALQRRLSRAIGAGGHECRCRRPPALGVLWGFVERRLRRHEVGDWDVVGPGDLVVGVVRAAEVLGPGDELAVGLRRWLLLERFDLGCGERDEALVLLIGEELRTLASTRTAPASRPGLARAR